MTQAFRYNHTLAFLKFHKLFLLRTYANASFDEQNEKPFIFFLVE